MKNRIKLISLIFAFMFLYLNVNAGVLVNDTVEGSQVIVYEFTTDGTWQAVTVPATMKNTRHVYLQVHDGTENSYAHSPVEFVVSSASDGSTGFIWTYGLKLSVGKDASGTICYIRAATGQTFSVMVLR